MPLVFAAEIPQLLLPMLKVVFCGAILVFAGFNANTLAPFGIEELGGDPRSTALPER